MILTELHRLLGRLFVANVQPPTHPVYHLAQEKAEEDGARLWATVVVTDELRTTAVVLFPAYRRSRFTSSCHLFEAWASPRFHAGSGFAAENPAHDPQSLIPKPQGQRRVGDGEVEDEPWLPLGVLQNALSSA